jgi:hypothetical protein
MLTEEIEENDRERLSVSERKAIISAYIRCNTGWECSSRS